ncbi:Uncharacterised protein [Clostridium paraputrificum]|nr:Uncharacterised protein [Clostridium paraputrificum]
MKKKIAYIILFIILICELIAYKYQYYFINSFYYLFINSTIFLIFLKLINNKTFTKVGVMLIILTILCFVALNNPTYNYIVQNDKLNYSLIVTETSSFNGKFQYSFFEKHFHFFKKPIPKAYFVSSYKINIDKDIQWLDKNTIQIKSGQDLINNLTLNLN